MSEPSVDDERVKEEIDGCGLTEEKQFEGVLFCQAQHRSLQPVLSFRPLSKEGRGKQKTHKNNENEEFLSWCSGNESD